VGTRLLFPQNVRATASLMVSRVMPHLAVSSTVPSRPRKLVAEPHHRRLARGECVSSINRADRADLEVSVDIAMGRSRLQRHRPCLAFPLRQHPVGHKTGLRLGKAKAKADPPLALPPPRLRDSAADPRLLYLGP
jgi:hypothetical protein